MPLPSLVIYTYMLTRTHSVALMPGLQRHEAGGKEHLLDQAHELGA